MSVRLYVGPPGSAKTLSMVHDTVQHFKAEKGTQVLANMSKLRCPEYIYVNGLEDFSNLTSGLVLLDEIGVFLPSRYWQSVSRDMLVQFAQVRKNGLDLWATTQHEARVDTVIRELLEYIIRCSKHGPLVLQRWYDPDETRKPLRRKAFLASKRTFRLYDTLETIGQDGATTGEGRANRRGPSMSRVASRRYDERNARLAAEREREKPVLYSWQGRERRLTSEAASSLNWLTENGFASRKAVNIEQEIGLEIQRRRWLDEWGLTVDDVPFSCTQFNPWLEGHSPEDAMRRKALRDLEEGQAVVRSAKSKLKMSG